MVKCSSTVAELHVWLGNKTFFKKHASVHFEIINSYVRDIIPPDFFLLSMFIDLMHRWVWIVEEHSYNVDLSLYLACSK